MAKGGRAELTVDYKEFTQKLDLLLHHVRNGTKKATRAMAFEILDKSLEQVPTDTMTLFDSAYVDEFGTKGNFGATIGYGGNGNPINPKTGRRASEYMIAVHEDLTAIHKDGKAKFLEDPIREYQKNFAARSASFIRKETGM